MNIVVFVLIFIIVIFFLIRKCITKQYFWKNKHQYIHSKLLFTLQNVQNVLSKYNIIYFVHDGTLLGCVRHQGFIPWDDDIDLCIIHNDNWDNNYDNIKRDLIELDMKIHINKGDFIQVYYKNYNCHIDFFIYDRKIVNGNVIYESNNWYTTRWPNNYYKEDELFPVVYKLFENTLVPCVNKNIDFLNRAFSNECLTKAKYQNGHSLNTLEHIFY